VTSGRIRPILWLAAALVAIAAVVALQLGDDDVPGDAASTSTTSTTAEPTTTSSTSTTSPPTTTTSSSTTTSTGPLLPQVVVEVRPGGGSGEVQLDWRSVAGATGYRVSRISDSGSATVVLDLDVTTGATTAAPEIVNAFSPIHSYVPSEGSLSAPDASTTFSVIDVSGPGQRCFRVTAYGDAGEGPPSAVTCASPP
jgi:hypothetical protein